MNANYSFDVFLFYGSRDKVVARDIAGKLVKDGLRVWFDEWEAADAPDIQSAFDSGVAQSRVILACVSANSLGSDWAKLESTTLGIRSPLNQDKRIIPLRLDASPLKGLLARLVALDWPGVDSEATYKRLLDACRTPEQRAEDRIAQWRLKLSKPDQFHGHDRSGVGHLDSEFSRDQKRLGRDHLDPTIWQRFGAQTPLLDLSHLNIKEVPPSLRRLTEIELLDLGFNPIERLPSWITELQGLKAIGLVRSRVRSLPSEIGKLRGLRGLGLGLTPLESLPPSIKELPLQYLFLRGNKNLRLPRSILERPAGEILRYYFEAKKGDPLGELKLLVVGRGGAGKTTLVKRLAGEKPNKKELETHSISIRELMLSCQKGQVRTRAWDFGGQEILHSTHQFFLTERSLYLLVLEPRSGLAQRDAEYWLKLIEMQGGGSPVIIAMNWSNGRPWRVDEVKLRRKFPFIVGFLSTDGLNGDGVDELRRLLIQVVDDRMKEVWLPFPTRWRQIKDCVASMRENFLTYSQFIKLCISFGEDDPPAQSDLAGILHALGLALYFGNDPRLHDTRVLNPGWVTGGVYAVIRAPTVATNNGQLAVEDMPVVLSEAQNQNVIKIVDYPPESHRFILELMRAFQLCYASEETAGRPSRFLVPELLPEFEPEMVEPWERAKVMLRYRYGVLPPGLVPRFIVRTHALSDESRHWRHGVVLRHSRTKALVRLESDKSELQVFVISGDADTQRVLVTMIRRELEWLHNELKIEPVEEIALSGKGEHWISVKALREVEVPGQVEQKLPVQPDGTADVNVTLELDKLLPASARAIDRKGASAPVPVRVFVSYAHEDERKLKRLDAILDVLEQQHGLTSWRDKRLIAGEEWDQEIRRRLDEMDIFVFVASQTSLVRPYIRDPELRRAEERHAVGDVEIVTVKLEPCACDDDLLLGKLQRLASRFRSIAEATLKSAAWEQVRKDLLPVIQAIRKRKTKQKPEQ